MGRLGLHKHKCSRHICTWIFLGLRFGCVFISLSLLVVCPKDNRGVEYQARIRLRKPFLGPCYTDRVTRLHILLGRNKWLISGLSALFSHNLLLWWDRGMWQVSTQLDHH